MYSAQTHSTTCTVHLTGSKPPFPLQINTPIISTAIDFADNTLHQRFLFTRWCNMHYGSLNRGNTLKFPGCQEAQVCGAETFFEYDIAPFYPKMNITNHPSYPPLAVLTDPARFYPRPTFQGFGLGQSQGSATGDMYNNREPGARQFYAPFVNPSAILRADSPEAKQQDARRLNGYTVTRAADAIGMPETWAPCPIELGFYYYDDLCFLRIDIPTTPGVSSSTPVTEFTRVCRTHPIIQSIPGAEAAVAYLVSQDENIAKWLDYFVCAYPQTVPYVFPTSVSGYCQCRLASIDPVTSVCTSVLYDCPCAGLGLCYIPAY